MIKMTVKHKCRSCQSENIVKNGRNVCGNQQYRCKDCGKTGSTLGSIDICPSCSGMFEQEHALSFQPAPGHEEKGRNLEHFITNDPAPIKRRLDELSKLSIEAARKAVREISVDIQAAKLLDAIHYMQIKDKEFADQVKSLQGWLGSL